MTDTIAPPNPQLEATKRVLDDALEKHGFDFGVFISVVVNVETGQLQLQVELALTGDGPSSLERHIPEVMRRLAAEVEKRMAVQTKAWLRTVS